ncbi:RNA recognition motif 2-domain-containing protein [Jackrogersella minutella]|nr:RNA recognition motif 2-domain-containing protein [Jackrogersella minutella]
MSFNSSDKMSIHQQAREGPFNPASPHSSSGAADSFKGTPDTRLTTFSPEDGSSRSTRALGALNASARDAGPIKYEMNALQSLGRSNVFNRGNRQADKDPFIASADSGFKARQKLSPTASVFSPLPSAMVSRGSASEPKRPDGLSEDPSQSYGQIPGLSSRPASMPSSSDFVHDKLSTDSGVSRCLIISARASGKVTSTEVEQYILELRQMGTPFQGSRDIYERGNQAFVRFTNIRDACTIFSNISLGGRDWDVRSVNPREFSSVVEPGAGLATAHEGQVYLSVFSHLANPVTAQQLEEFVKAALRSEGDLYAFKRHEGVAGSLMSAIVEYCDNDMSLRAASKLNSLLVEGFQICMVLYRPDLMPSTPQGGIVSSAQSITTPAELTTGFRRMSIGRPQSVMPSATSSLLGTPARSAISSGGYAIPQSYGMVPLVYPGLPVSPPYVFDQTPSRSYSSMVPSSNYSLASPTLSHQSSLLSSDLMTPRQFQHYGRPDGRRQNAMRVARSPGYNANHHNQVDVNHIRDGIDVRTTIMLRNIPNKVDQALLKRIVDESSWGKYDFMYLRIDFANDCNVGYAFINFVDPLDIIDFVHARGNQRWNCFRSDKVAEISYATIQGKDCLVQKFRNSSVMLEAPHYRPKLFYTLNGPRPDLAGNEEPFPEPDNQSKMKRSCENAEHVGLFTPNAGQHFRDEQRRRRSQFDRGNPRLEEYDYGGPFYNQSFYSAQ